ncbi:arginine N-succinyltransferase [Chitinimonas sp.]|uniref:arginine N-succinyltransferase n=1 Tax=Chitinimonas sp. TaxID=1934313 RepID=UPI002F951B6C
MTSANYLQLTSRPAQAADLAALQALRMDFCQLAGEPDTAPTHAGGFLLTENAEGRLLGCLRLTVRAGLDAPRYAYHVGTVVHAASELGLFQRQHTLLLGNDLTGCAELGEVAWDNKTLTPAEQAQLLRHMLGVALQELALQCANSGERLFVELAGLRDPAGQAVFWQGMGKPFCRYETRAAQARFGADWQRHVAALLPKHAIYASFLPHAVQRSIGQAAPQLHLWQAALVEAGFAYGQHVRIDDGGPIYEAEIDLLAPIRAARAALAG